jgi:ppGpp synthetase/RelA/SpoT-type nucleotidyltranferase
MVGDRPERRHNTNPWEYFSRRLKHLSCLAAKAIIAKSEIIQNSAESAPLGLGVFTFDHL